MIRAYKEAVPKIHPTAFVEASAHVIGDVDGSVIHGGASP